MAGPAHEGHRDEILDAGSDARGDGQDVVDEERRRCDEAELDADVVFRDDIRSASARIGEDGLDIGDRDDDEQIEAAEFTRESIPWDELAFRSTEEGLRDYFSRPDLRLFSPQP